MLHTAYIALGYSERQVYNRQGLGATLYITVGLDLIYNDQVQTMET